MKADLYNSIIATVVILVFSFAGYQGGLKKSGRHLHDIPKSEYRETFSSHLCRQPQYDCRMFIKSDVNANTP